MQSSSIGMERHAEAARYTLLRRLAPAMRHEMGSGFQPVMMLATIIEKRLLSSAPDIATLTKNSNEMRTLATAATHSSLNFIRWLALEPNARVSLGKGIEDTLRVVATELSFRGIKFVNQTKSVSTEVALDHVHGVFVAALLALTDAAAGSANVLITASQDGQDMLLTLTLTEEDTSKLSTPNEEILIGLAAYRKIDWVDVQAIADADGLSVIHESGRVMLRLPIASTER